MRLSRSRYRSFVPIDFLHALAGGALAAAVCVMLAAIAVSVTSASGCATTPPSAQAPRIIEPIIPVDPGVPAVFETSDVRRYAVVVTNGRGHGSGVLIDINGQQFVLTASHVVEQPAEPVFISLPRPSGQTFALYQLLGLVVGQDKKFDLALVKPMAVITERFPATLAAIDPPIGARVRSCGVPSVLFGLGIVTEGIVSAVGMGPDGVQIMHADAAVIPGCSGGGIFDMEGRLVGVIQRNYPGASLTWFTGPSDIRQFLISSGHLPGA